MSLSIASDQNSKIEFYSDFNKLTIFVRLVQKMHINLSYYLNQNIDFVDTV
jgi:hypothetical protein